MKEDRVGQGKIMRRSWETRKYEADRKPRAIDIYEAAINPDFSVSPIDGTRLKRPVPRIRRFTGRALPP